MCAVQHVHPFPGPVESERRDRRHPGRGHGLLNRHASILTDIESVSNRRPVTADRVHVLFIRWKDHDDEPAAAGGADERWELPVGRTFPGTCRPARAGGDSRRTWIVRQVQVRLVAVAAVAARLDDGLRAVGENEMWPRPG